MLMFETSYLYSACKEGRITMWLGMSSAFWYKKVQSVNVYTESLFFKLVLVG